MPLVRFRYEIEKEKATRIPDDGYDIDLEVLGAAGVFERRGRHRGVTRFPRRSEFRETLTGREMGHAHIRLKITRNEPPGRSCTTAPMRLALRLDEQDVDLPRHRLMDGDWHVAGTVVPIRGSGLDPSLLTVSMQVRSGARFERPLTLPVDASGRFGYRGPWMLLSPGKDVELVLKVHDESGQEVGRHYSRIEPSKPHTAEIKVGSPFLDVGAGFASTHPEMARKLQEFGHSPRGAHKNDDQWFAFRRWKVHRIYQIAEGVVVRAKPGPPGDPDSVWDIRLDRYYDSDDGFRLPNEKNRIKHKGLHVEACKSLGRGRLRKDGLKATHENLKAGTRVWMLGTYVYDDTWDLGTPDHEHFELHPLYVMEPCLGPWFHFATFESIALAPLAAQVRGSEERAWPWTSRDAEAYERVYVTIGPEQASQEMAASYGSIYEHFVETDDPAGLVRFFVDVALRHDSYGIATGLPGFPTEADYRAWAEERIEQKRPSHIREAMVNRLIGMWRFLYGAPSSALAPVHGPAPQSLLRCVYAMEHALVARATDGSVGEPNPRISINRAASRTVLTAERELGELYATLFDQLADADRRAELFADAVVRYRSWGAKTTRASESLGRAELHRFAAARTPKELASEMRSRVAVLWKLLTPFRSK